MKRILLIGLLSQFILIQAQELDESFLDSLPEDVREDIVKRADKQSELAEQNYRPSQYSSKLKQAEELVDLKMRLEQDLFELRKRLESDEVLKIDPELKLFGSDFFSTFQKAAFWKIINFIISNVKYPKCIS